MKNLKKGLAVAMALAMVTTVMPTNVFAAADQNTSTTCTDKVAYVQAVMAYENGLVTLGDLDEITSGTVFTKTDTTKTEAGLTNVVAYINVIKELIKPITAQAACLTTEDATKYIKETKKLGDLAKLMEDLGKALSTLNITSVTSANVDAVKAAIKLLKENDNHLTDVEIAKTASLTAKAEKLIAIYEKTVVTTADDVVKKIQEIVVTKTGLTVDLTVKDDATDVIEIKDITEYDYKGLKAAATEVEEYVADLSATLRRDAGVKAAVKEVNDALETATNYNKYNVIVEDFFTELAEMRATTLKTFETKLATAISSATVITTTNKADFGINEYDTFDETNANVFVINEKAVNDIFGSVVNSDVIDALNTIVKGLEDFVTISVESTGRRYNVYVDKGDYFAYLGSQESLAIDLAQIFMAPTVKNGKLTGNTLLETLETYLDDVTAKYNKVIKANKLTDEVEEIYAELIAGGNLTGEEVAKLHVAYYALKGITGQVGWVDLGNGNWDFFNADGTVSTKWVAAGKDWYFVQVGHMLRNSWVAKDSTGNVWYYVDNAGKMVSNTTVDGYVINANGEWHK